MIVEKNKQESKHVKYLLDKIESGPLYKHMERDYSMFFLTAFKDAHTRANKKGYGDNGLSIALMVFENLVSKYYRLEQDNETLMGNFADNIFKNSSLKNELFESYTKACEGMLEFYDRIDKDEIFDDKFVRNFSKVITDLITYQVCILHRSESFVKRFEKTPGVSDEIYTIRKKYERVFGLFETKFELLCNKILSKLKDVNLLDLKYLTCHELADLLKAGKFSREVVEERKKLVVISYLPKIEIFVGSDAKKLLNAIQDNEIKNNQETISKNEIFGKAVYGKGKISGVCQVITDYTKVDSLEDGKILVTPSTLPKYNSVYKRAKAIITNEGGVLAHVTIFCREFKIPGVIGTKIATSFLKEGMRIEIDLNKGVVRVLD